MSEQRCEDCKWWFGPTENDEHGGLGECRIKSPFVTGGLHNPTETVWPMTRLHWFCGEYSPRDGKAKLAGKP